MWVQELTAIEIEMTRIKRDQELSDATRKQMLEGQTMLLYKASGKAKLQGTLEQIEQALDEGAICPTSCSCSQFPSQQL